MKTKQTKQAKLHWVDDGVAHFVYKGHTVQLRRYPSDDTDDKRHFYVDRMGWGPWIYFVSVNGDSYPHGLTLPTEGRAIGEAKRRITKGEVETDEFWKKYGHFSPDFHPDRPYWDKVQTAATRALTERSIRGWYHELLQVINVNAEAGWPVGEYYQPWHDELKRLEAQYQEFGGHPENLL